MDRRVTGGEVSTRNRERARKWLDPAVRPSMFEDTVSSLAAEFDAVESEAWESAKRAAMLVARTIVPGGVHADDAPKSTSALLNAAVKLSGELQREDIAQRIEALTPPRE